MKFKILYYLRTYGSSFNEILSNLHDFDRKCKMCNIDLKKFKQSYLLKSEICENENENLLSFDYVKKEK